MEIFGVILSLVGLMYFAYKGVNVLVLAPLMALFACLFQAGTPYMGVYTQVFMPALGGYLLKYFPIFLLGSIFGKFMSDSGAAEVIGQFIAGKLGSERGVLAVVLACGLLTYGGVSLFVVAFCMYPIANSLFQNGNIPKRLIPASIALGSFTFTMTSLPGTPAIQNAIPMPYFGTTAFAAPGLGMIGALVMFFSGMGWLNSRTKKAHAKGEGFGGEFVSNKVIETVTSVTFFKALCPLIIVVVLNYLFSKIFLPRFDHTYLSELKYGAVSPSQVLGLWSLIISLTLSILILFLIYRKQYNNALKTLNEGTYGSLLPIFNTASEVGYGATIASLSSFVLIKDSVLGITPEYPLVSEAISINVLAGITGSASGGLSIALEALSESYLSLAAAANISPELLHRVASMACGGFDTLPHNGAVITLLTICGLTHKKSYFDIGMVAVVFPFLATCVVILIGTLTGSF